jgi:hypothetical protein
MPDYDEDLRSRLAPTLSAWRDASVVGSNFEQQIELSTGRWRHRPRMTFAMPGWEPFHESIHQHPDDGWRYGPAPK